MDFGDVENLDEESIYEMYKNLTEDDDSKIGGYGCTCANGSWLWCPYCVNHADCFYGGNGGACQQVFGYYMMSITYHCQCRNGAWNTCVWCVSEADCVYGGNGGACPAQGKGR